MGRTSMKKVTSRQFGAAFEKLSQKKHHTQKQKLRIKERELRNVVEKELREELNLVRAGKLHPNNVLITVHYYDGAFPAKYRKELKKRGFAVIPACPDTYRITRIP